MNIGSWDLLRCKIFSDSFDHPKFNGQQKTSENFFRIAPKRDPWPLTRSWWNMVEIFYLYLIIFTQDEIPSRELTYPTWGSWENHLQKCLSMGYVSSLEGRSADQLTNQRTQALYGFNAWYQSSSASLCSAPSVFRWSFRGPKWPKPVELWLEFWDVNSLWKRFFFKANYSNLMIESKIPESISVSCRKWKNNVNEPTTTFVTPSCRRSRLKITYLRSDGFQ